MRLRAAGYVVLDEVIHVDRFYEIYNKDEFVGKLKPYSCQKGCGFSFVTGCGLESTCLTHVARWQNEVQGLQCDVRCPRPTYAP